jgi:Ulp1 family protease
MEQNMNVITVNFTDDSVLDEIQYSQFDQQVLYTLEKKAFGFEVKHKLQILRKDFESLNSNEWLTDTIIEAYFLTWVDSQNCMF